MRTRASPAAAAVHAPTPTHLTTGRPTSSKCMRLRQGRAQHGVMMKPMTYATYATRSKL